MREPTLFAATIEEPRPRGGVSIWLAAAAALVIGIGIGFASGYRAGKGATSVAATTTENPGATSGATGGQPFSESAVQDPVKLNPEPIVPTPASPTGPADSVQPDPRRRLERAAEPAPQPQPTKVPAAVGRVPPRTQAIAADPPAPTTPSTTGSAPLEVVSRPSGAQVILDGRSIGKTPMTIPDVAAGGHTIQLELAGFKGWRTTVDVKAGNSTRVAASLEQ